jgi:hypothetical protein
LLASRRCSSSSVQAVEIQTRICVVNQKSIARIVSRKRSRPSMLADVNFPHDECIQERRPRLCTDITYQRYTHQIPWGNLCGQYRLIYNAARHLQHSRTAAHSPSKPGQVGAPTKATGGALNPSKCYWYMAYYVCQNGQREYGNTVQHRLTILLPGGDCKAIEQLPVTEEKKMLGVWSSPTGSDTKHLQEVILGKMSKWVGRLKNASWKAY